MPGLFALEGWCTSLQGLLRLSPEVEEGGVTLQQVAAAAAPDSTGSSVFPPVQWALPA